MPKRFLLEARLCAVGGQGIVLGSEILAHAAIFHEGLYAIQTPSFGSQVRGGPTKVDILIDKEEILATTASHITFFMAIAQSSFNKYWKDVADDAVVLLDSNLVSNIREDQRGNRKFFTLPVVEIAKKDFGNVMLSNMICLGVIQEVTQIVSKESLLKAVEAKVPPKHLAVNIKAVELGIELAKKELGAAAHLPAASV